MQDVPAGFRPARLLRGAGPALRDRGAGADAAALRAAGPVHLRRGGQAGARPARPPGLDAAPAVPAPGTPDMGTRNPPPPRSKRPKFAHNDDCRPGRRSISRSTYLRRSAWFVVAMRRAAGDSALEDGVPLRRSGWRCAEGRPCAPDDAGSSRPSAMGAAGQAEADARAHLKARLWPPAAGARRAGVTSKCAAGRQAGCNERHSESARAGAPSWRRKGIVTCNTRLLGLAGSPFAGNAPRRSAASPETC